jgi:hypothetical protein
MSGTYGGLWRATEKEVNYAGYIVSLLLIIATA